MVRIGFIVNPIAGMGGRVGLKGTDGEAYLEALRRGAKPIAPERARRFLEALRTRQIELVVAGGRMGYDIASRTRLRDRIVEVIDDIVGETTAEDTRRVASLMKKNVELIVFVGGDGTARDIMDAVDQEVPVLGVPSGVKIYSAAFAVSPEAAARVLEAYIEGRTELVLREVLDIDEEEYRGNRLVVRLYGYLLVPVVEGLVQSSKAASIPAGSEAENQKAIARWVAENMEPDTLYILGPGTTIKAIADELGVEKTLLGVDAVYNGRLVGRDLAEKDLLQLLDAYGRAWIIVTPIGGQGFIFGRGNQQISPRVIKRVGRERILVVATRRKIAGLPVLRVDTGDPVVDDMLRGYIRVLVDYNYFVVKKVV